MTTIDVASHGTRNGSDDGGLILGQIVQGKGMLARVKRWDESPTVAWITKHELRERRECGDRNGHIELVHLFIMPDVVHITLDEFRERGFTLGDLVGYAEKNIHELAQEFLPELAVADMSFLSMVHSERDVIGTFYVSVLIGRTSLMHKYLPRINDPIIRPTLVEIGVRAHTRKVCASEYGND